MKISISYPPLDSGKGIALLTQNRQFQWFNEPTFIYPVVPASAATLLKSRGYNVIWDDAIAEGLTYGQWRSRITGKDGPDLIVFETKTPVVKKHWKIINDLKAEFPDLKIVLMGDHVSAMPLETFENSKTDYIITGGDYDFLLLSLADFLTKNSPPEPGIYWKNGKGEVLNSGRFERKYSLDDLPMIDRDLTRWELYAFNNGNYKKTPGAYTMAGRDCWYHQCTFCSWTTLFPSFNKRKPSNLLDEIGMLVEKYSVKEIMDDTGTFPVGDWLREFCEGMINRGYNKKISIDCNMRLGSSITKEDAVLMKKAGFRLILVGIESGNQATLDRIKKGETIDEMITNVKMLRKAGLYPHITIMFGYPWETGQDAERTLKMGKDLLIKNYAYTMQATIVIPYPGTPLFDECKENGWLNTNDWDMFDMRGPVMKSPIGGENLMKLVQGLYSVSFNPEFLARKLLSVRDLGDLMYFARAGKKVLGHIFDFKNK
jgi:radical SAM superfamily enzyme YgiQ (UPF0313 family)